VPLRTIEAVMVMTWVVAPQLPADAWAMAAR